MADRKEYRVGRFVLRPHRQLLDGEVPVAIGRKALELLSVLAEAEGDLVTKDELMAAVWPKAIVEDNAIQVHVAALRKLLGADADLLSTTHGLGYRLAVTRRVEALAGAAVPGGDARADPGARPVPVALAGGYHPSGAAEVRPEPAPTPPAAAVGTRRRGRLYLAGAGVLVLVAGALVTLKLAGGAATGGETVEVERLRVPAGDAASALFADGLAGALARQVESRATGMRVLDAQETLGRARPELVVEGEARSMSGRLNAVIQVRAAKDPSIVWSTSYEAPLADAARLRRWAALDLAGVLTCAVRRGDEAAGGDAVLDLMLSECEAIQSNNTRSEAIRDILRKAVARAPRFARAWSELAVAEAYVTTHHDDLPALTSADGRQAEADAQRALALDPHQSRPWLARALLADRVGQWAEQEADFKMAAALDPEDALATAEHGNAMAQVGRMKEAMALHRRAADLDPLSEDMASRLALDQAFTDDWPGAEATLRVADLRWTDNDDLSQTRFYVASRAGDAAMALQLLETPLIRGGLSAVEYNFWRLLLAARMDPRRRAQALDFINAHSGKDLDSILAVQGFAILGRPDRALDVLEHDEAVLNAHPGLRVVLFREPYMHGVMASPRFMALAAGIGLVRDWRRTGRWPDFCTAAPYDCKSAAHAAESVPRGSSIPAKKEALGGGRE